MERLEGHKARKRFGQNFLHDEHWIRRIAAAVDARPGQSIIEIGPGQAALTRELIAAAASLLTRQSQGAFGRDIPPKRRQD